MAEKLRLACAVWLCWSTLACSGSDADSGGKDSGDPARLNPLNQIGKCPVFPTSDPWNTDVSALPVDSDATSKLRALVGTATLHPDYGVNGNDLWGIPINVVPESQASVPVSFDKYPRESDPGPYPFPSPEAALIEGNTPRNCDGDCHLLVVEQGKCLLFEGYACEYEQDGWHCSNGAKWDLTKPSYGQRPMGWTSADAAGLPIAPGLLRYDEVRAGEVTHAVRFTLKCTADEFVNPATHDAVPRDCDPSQGLPMGTRVRLRADYDIGQASSRAQVVLRAMKKYGMILADNGSNFFFQGQSSASWSDDDIEPLKLVPASEFEVVAPPR